MVSDAPVLASLKQPTSCDFHQQHYLKFTKNKQCDLQKKMQSAAVLKKKCDVLLWLCNLRLGAQVFVLDGLQQRKTRLCSSTVSKEDEENETIKLLYLSNCMEENLLDLVVSDTAKAAPMDPVNAAGLRMRKSTHSPVEDHQNTIA